MLPNLFLPRSALTRDPGSDVPSGIYCLDRQEDVSPCNSKIYLYRAFMKATPYEFEEAARFMTDKVADDKTMGQLVPRKQCTFGPVQYKRYQLFNDRSQWPILVKNVLEATIKLAKQLGFPNPEAYQGVHANYYVDGNSSVQKHADDEPQLIDGAPIFSYTFIQGDNNALARPFTIWHNKKASDIEGNKQGGRVADIVLRSGDLLIMAGDMQSKFLHSIEKSRTSEVAPRLNFTVRQFNEKPSAPKRKQERLAVEDPRPSKTLQTDPALPATPGPLLWGDQSEESVYRD